MLFLTLIRHFFEYYRTFVNITSSFSRKIAAEYSVIPSLSDTRNLRGKKCFRKLQELLIKKKLDEGNSDWIFLFSEKGKYQNFSKKNVKNENLFSSVCYLISNKSSHNCQFWRYLVEYLGNFTKEHFPSYVKIDN